MIVIIDYGVGNLQSILNKLKRIDVDAVISSNPEEIQNARKLILPGVGAFENGMKNLRKFGLLSVLSKKIIEEKTPILGICLGMHLFTKSSEEGHVPGLGWIDCTTKKFKFAPKTRLKIPHIGWNTLEIEKNHPILKGITNDSSFYFLHSYHLVCPKEDVVLARTNYGYDFVSAVQKENILGVQFHPEKSHKNGLQLLRNFAEEI
jgi:glutamine amidotransferase